MHPMIDWWMKEQEKKKDLVRANEIALINRQLQELLHRIAHKIDRAKYKKEADQAGRGKLVQCSIWNITYRNNMENPDVALSQGLLISYILKHEEMENKSRFQEEVDILMRRLGNVDWGLYLEYGRLRGRVVQ